MSDDRFVIALGKNLLRCERTDVERRDCQHDAVELSNLRETNLLLQEVIFEL